MGGPDGGPATFMGLFRGGGLAQVVADHLGPVIHLDEGLAVAEAHHAAHHLGLDVAAPRVCIHHLWLLWAVPPGWLCRCCGHYRRCVSYSEDVASSWSRRVLQVTLWKVRCCCVSAILSVFWKRSDLLLTGRNQEGFFGKQTVVNIHFGGRWPEFGSCFCHLAAM